MRWLAWPPGLADGSLTGRGPAGRGPAGRALAERGSGTVLTLGLVAVVCMLMGGIALLGRAQCARATAQTAADLGALAAAQDVLDGSSGGVTPGSGGEVTPGSGGGTACAVARQVASANGSSLTGCSVLEGGVVRVTTLRSGGLGAATASARAGPAPSGPG